MTWYYKAEQISGDFLFIEMSGGHSIYRGVRGGYTCTTKSILNTGSGGGGGGVNSRGK